MKNVFYALLCSASLVLFGSNNLYASEEPIWSVRAAIIGVEECCFMVRVDIVTKTNQFEIVMASATVHSGVQDCCSEDRTNGYVSFIELEGYSNSIFDYYGKEPKITSAIDEIVHQFSDGGDKRNDIFIKDYDDKMLAYFEKGGAVLNLMLSKPINQNVKVVVSNINGQILAIYPSLKFENEKLEIYAKGFSSDAYIIKVFSQEGRAIAQSVLKG